MPCVALFELRVGLHLCVSRCVCVCVCIYTRPPHRLFIIFIIIIIITDGATEENLGYLWHAYERELAQSRKASRKCVHVRVCERVRACVRVYLCCVCVYVCVCVRVRM